MNVDFSDSTKYTVSFETCYTGIEPGVIKNGGYEKIEQAYRDYIQTLFIASGQSVAEATNNARSVSRFCIKLAEATMDEAQWDNPAEIYNVYTPKELRDLFSGINISGYLASLGYEISDNIVVYDKNLASTINSYLKRSNLKLLKLYLKAAVLDCSALYLNSQMFNAYQNYINTISGVTTKVSSEAYAVKLPVDYGHGNRGRIY